MDVRCEKCQTEYELDEARLKPGGVTVKCTNCGHMFKIRKRSATDVGAVASQVTAVAPAPISPATSGAPTKPDLPRAKAASIKPASRSSDDAGAAEDERQWMIRLENGEQKSCRELATLQQWIVGGTVTRDALISRTGKTWKRIGDIAELAQFFVAADDARAQRAGKPTAKPGKELASTMLGMGTKTGASAAGGTILPDDDDDELGRTTGEFKARPLTTPPPLPPKARPLTTPPPPPGKKTMGGNVTVPEGSRSTAAWASKDVSPSASMASMPSGPAAGKLRVDKDEPAFAGAGRVRIGPSEDSRFSTGRTKQIDDDDDEVMQHERGSRSGTLLVILALLVMGAAAGAIYVFVIKKDTTQVAGNAPIIDAGAGSAGSAALDAAEVPAADAAQAVDANVVPVAGPVDLAHDVLGIDVETKLRDALKTLDGLAPPSDVGADAMRAHLITSLAQSQLDRAALADKVESEKLKKDVKQLVLDAAAPATKAIKAAPDDTAANLAMAAVLRLQAKPTKDVVRYLQTAMSKATPEWKRDVAVGGALVLVRDNKLVEAAALLAPLDQGDDRLEISGDARVRFRLAMIAFAQNKPADAKPLVESILAAQPDHAGAKALSTKLAATVAKTDPLPPEENNTPPTNKPPPTNTLPTNTPVGGDSYDKLLARANAQAESSCSKAIEMYAKALEQKPNGVEALTGMGYCHIDAKQFASAFSKFRAALAVSSRFEPALWGIAEAYMQQGRKEQALEAVKAYLEVYPNAAKGQKALDRLGGSTPTPTPTPPETPAPTPPPPAEGAGSSDG